MGAGVPGREEQETGSSNLLPLQAVRSSRRSNICFTSLEWKGSLCKLL